MTALSTTLDRELDWLERRVEAAIYEHFQDAGAKQEGKNLHAPDLAGDTSLYATAVRDSELCEDDRLILILSLAADVRPHALDAFLIRNTVTDRPFTVFGGAITAQGGFLPTVETALFILSAGALERRFDVLRRLQREAPLLARKLIHLQQGSDQSIASTRLQMDPNWLSLITTGMPHRPAYRADFPARRLTTEMEWDDLVLPAHTEHEVGEILAWLEHGESLLAEPGLAKLIQQGYRSLFYGPPGTGKTLTATLLGKMTGRDVYRVDLSMVVSKWVGETEKNLANIFDQAEGSGWILLFDEADALFGKRTEVSHANDRYANQEVSYILQRVEDFNSVVILASNLKGNIDSAFSRRFQSIIRFPPPGPAERKRLWEKVLLSPGRAADDVDIEALAERYELTGAAIVNVLRYSLLAARRAGRLPVCRADIIDGISREMHKDGRVAEVDR